jgi:hypothetical protein
MTHRIQVYWLSQLLLIDRPGTKTCVHQSSGADQQRFIPIQTQPWGLFYTDFFLKFSLCLYCGPFNV